MTMRELLGMTAAYVVPGFLYELRYGYPRLLGHPVRLMGRLISLFDSLFRDSSSGSFVQKAAGAAVVAMLVPATYAFFGIIEWSIKAQWLLYSFRVFCTVAIVATGSLVRECAFVLSYLDRGLLVEARQHLSLLVTRDTSAMDETEVCRTTIETLSENFCDGVVAPLFFLALGGVPLAMAYKMASTLDSMIGYKNRTYRHFGWAAARLDDLLAWIPARLSVPCIMVAACMTGLDGEGSARVWMRDRRKTESPNGGHPEAAFAGALGVWFGGAVNYFGKLSEKPVIGDRNRDAGREDVVRALRLARLSSLLCLVAFFAVETVARWR